MVETSLKDCTQISESETRRDLRPHGVYSLKGCNKVAIKITSVKGLFLVIPVFLTTGGPIQGDRKHHMERRVLD